MEPIKFTTTFDQINQAKLNIADWKKKFFKEIIDIQMDVREISEETAEVTLSFVNNPVIKYNGWTYVATCERVMLDGGTEETLIHSNETVTTAVDFRCDHCNTSHFRKIVHIFKDEAGKQISIGSACVKGYFGVDSISELSKLLTVYANFSDFCDEMEGFFGCRSAHRFEKETFAKIVYGIIKQTGSYVSRSSCDEFSGKSCTTDIALKLLEADRGNSIESAKEKHEALEAAKDFDYNKVEEYWLAKTDDSDFVQNIQISLRMVQPKAGFIAYSVWEYMREVEDVTGKNKIAATIKNSLFIGTPKEKMELEVEVISLQIYETQYGTGEIIKFVTNDGNLLTWFSSNVQSASSDDFAKGNKIKIKFTVKDHNEFRGVNSTIVTRVKKI